MKRGRPRNPISRKPMTIYIRKETKEQIVRLVDKHNPELDTGGKVVESKFKS